MEEKDKIRCHFCNTELDIKKAEKRANARGYGYYITCPNCNEEKVLIEIEE